MDVLLSTLSPLEWGTERPNPFFSAWSILMYFAIPFGFETPKVQFRRWKKLADDYAAKAPPRSGAPHFNLDFLGYLEKVILSKDRGIVERVTAAKLRLCIQASIRHNDLLSTPLHMMEWCRFLGSDREAGVRAKAPRTKSGVRPWVASFLGVCPNGDGWLEGAVFVFSSRILSFPFT